MEGIVIASFLPNNYTVFFGFCLNSLNSMTTRMQAVYSWLEWPSVSGRGGGGVSAGAIWLGVSAHAEYLPRGLSMSAETGGGWVY